MLLTRFHSGLWLTFVLILSGCGRGGQEYHVVTSADVATQTPIAQADSSSPAILPDNNPTASTPATDTLQVDAIKMRTADPKPAVTDKVPIDKASTDKLPGEVAANPLAGFAANSPEPTTGAMATGEAGTPPSAASTAGPVRALRTAATEHGEPLKIKLLIPQKEFTREGASKALRVTFDDLDLLKVCNMEPVPPDVMDYLPDWLKNLQGQKIILRGWMFPSGRQEGISSFMFVRDNGICCFGRDPKVYDKLAVTMQPGKTTRYIAGRPFDVEATLLIEPDIEGPEEGLWWLYRLEDARVIDQ